MHIHVNHRYFFCGRRLTNSSLSGADSLLAATGVAPPRNQAAKAKSPPPNTKAGGKSQSAEAIETKSEQVVTFRVVLPDFDISAFDEDAKVCVSL